MGLTNLIPAPYRWLALALLMAAVYGFGWMKGAQHGEGKLEQYKLAEQVEINKGMKAAADKTHEWQKGKDDALQQATKRAQVNAAAAASARRTADSLRDDLAAARADLSRAADAAVRQYAATLGTVFGECAAALGELAGKAQGHASDALTFEQSWPKP